MDVISLPNPFPSSGGRLGWGEKRGWELHRPSPPPSPSPIEGEGIRWNSSSKLCTELDLGRGSQGLLPGLLQGTPHEHAGHGALIVGGTTRIANRIGLLLRHSSRLAQQLGR